MPMMKSYKNVDAYIADQPKQIQDLLEKLRATIRKAAPKSDESISYGMPAYKFYRPLVYFGAFKDHIGFFPTPSAINHFAEQLKDYYTAKGTVHFEFSKPLPVRLVADIVKFRIHENLVKQETKKMATRKKAK
jgi:uncharacterized protein YdhG (YjbR/CyaY superfamily)